MNRRNLVQAIAASFACLGIMTEGARPAAPEQDGVVSVRSAYGFDETIERLKADIAAKKIMLFDVIDQAKLASGAGIELRPSTLIVFGNPPLGVQFLTSKSAAGLDWPVRLLVTMDAQGQVLRDVHGFRLDRPAARHRESRRAIQDGFRGHCLDRRLRRVKVALNSGGHSTTGTTPHTLLKRADSDGVARAASASCRLRQFDHWQRIPLRGGHRT